MSPPVAMPAAALVAVAIATPLLVAWAVRSMQRGRRQVVPSPLVRVGGVTFGLAIFTVAAVLLTDAMRSGEICLLRCSNGTASASAHPRFFWQVAAIHYACGIVGAALAIVAVLDPPDR